MIELESAAFATLTNVGVMQSPAARPHEVRHIEGDVAAVIFDFDGTLTCTPGDRSDRRTKMKEMMERAVVLKPWLQALRDADVTLGIMSKSTQDTVCTALEQAGMRDMFDGPVMGKAVGFDGKVGFIKELCQKSGLKGLGPNDVHRVLLIDDDMSELVRAREWGVQTYPAPEDGGLQIEDLAEILKAMKISEPPCFYDDDLISRIFSYGFIGRSRSCPFRPTQIDIPEDDALRISQHYDIDQLTMLGQGSFGWIRPGAHKSSGTPIAVKFVRKHSPATKSYMKNFVEDDMWTFLLQMSFDNHHPNVLQYFDFFIGPKILYTMMEQLTGEDLLLYLKAKSPITEGACKNILFQLLTALNFVHSVMVTGIIHCDVKLENLRFRSQASDTLVLVDFGLCCPAKPEEQKRRVVGTLPYMAPEVFSKRYTTQVDLWSTGVMLFIILKGALPWQDNPFQSPLAPERNQEYVDEAINTCKAVNSPSMAVDLLKGLLQLEPTKRLTAAKALSQPWMAIGVGAIGPSTGPLLAARHDQFEAPKRAGRDGSANTVGGSQAIFESLLHSDLGELAAFSNFSGSPSGV